MPNSTSSLTSDPGGRPNPDSTARQKAEAEIRCPAEELRAANEDLTRFNQTMVGWELRMIELKQEVNALSAQFDQPLRYGPEADN
jgi:hypothetical protein